MYSRVMTKTKAICLTPGRVLSVPSGDFVVSGVRYTHKIDNGTMVTVAHVRTVCGKIIDVEAIFD